MWSQFGYCVSKLVTHLPVNISTRPACVCAAYDVGGEELAWFTDACELRNGRSAAGKSVCVLVEGEGGDVGEGDLCVGHG